MNSPSATAPGSEGAPVMRNETPSGRRSVFMKSSHLRGQHAGSGRRSAGAPEAALSARSTLQAALSFGKPRTAPAACARRPCRPWFPHGVPLSLWHDAGFTVVRLKGRVLEHVLRRVVALAVGMLLARRVPARPAVVWPLPTLSVAALAHPRARSVGPSASTGVIHGTDATSGLGPCGLLRPRDAFIIASTPCSSVGCGDQHSGIVLLGCCAVREVV